MNLSFLLEYKKISDLGFDSEITEKSLPDIVDFDYKTILNPPLKNTDRRVIDELKLVSRMTKSRTKQDTEFVYSIDQDIDTPFINLLIAYKISYPLDHIKSFYKIVKPILLNIKSYWNRPRPIQLAKFYDIDINIIPTDTIHTASYPSGHTVYSSLVANIIKNMYPEVDKKALDSIVSETAKARVMQGVHYPSDNFASLIFSEFVFKKLHNKL